MKTFFLRAAHWQIFSLMAALYFADWFFAISLIGAKPILVRSVPVSTTLVLQGTSMIVLGIFLAWLWALGSFLNLLVRPPLRLNLAFFRFALLFPIAYGLAFPLVAWSPRPFTSYVVFPVHLFVMFCLAYDFRFVAKSLALQEEVRFLTFRDYHPAFFLLWFAPIGIWWIQPKINRLYFAKVAEHRQESAVLKSRT